MAVGGEFTRRLLRDAGIGRGMRVLDIGCGYGDVSLIAAECVGLEGSVTGIDVNDAALDQARLRAEGRSNIRFHSADLATLDTAAETYDAVVGRRVLMYLPDIDKVLGSLARMLRPGGLMVFQEHDTTMVPVSGSPLPLHATVQGWLQEMIRREGADLRMGFHLHEVLTRAGLTVEHVRAEALVQTPTQPYPLADIVRAVMARIVGQGIVTAEEIAIDTLARRLDDERRASPATYIGDMMFGVWARHSGTGCFQVVADDGGTI